MKASTPLPIRNRQSYLPPGSVRETSPRVPTELEVQALWFEQFHQRVLTTDDGRTVEVIQPGFWNHGSGPDFTRAALRFSKEGRQEEIMVGNVEIHLRPTDWNAHGHHIDPNYDETILHVVWEPRMGKSFFPATASFRQVPQVMLNAQLIAPWTELQPLCASLLHAPLPGAVPGRCSPVLAELPAEQIGDVLRTAGLFRLRQKARRWYWRKRMTSPEQALYEALAEALGFHANQIPMRLTAQRLLWKKMRGLDSTGRLAHLFGLAGFLPDESVTRLESEPRVWLRELWEIWWKGRGALDYALLSRSRWRLAGLRPLNRPERRLAALAHIIPAIPELLAALKAREAKRFGAVLLAICDPFWEKHATLSGTALRKPCRLIGEERVHDILINIFWPMILLEDPEAAREGLQTMSMPSNSAARLATQRTLISTLTAKQRREAWCSRVSCKSFVIIARPIVPSVAIAPSRNWSRRGKAEIASYLSSGLSVLKINAASAPAAN